MLTGSGVSDYGDRPEYIVDSLNSKSERIPRLDPVGTARIFNNHPEKLPNLATRELPT